MKSAFQIGGLAVTLVLLLPMLAERAQGFSVYRDRIPNGRHVPHPCKPNYLWRGMGHANPLGGGVKNVFGADFLRLGARWSEELCRLDSDENGLTNGQELGDPDCVWTEEDLPARTSNITHPGVCDPWESSLCRVYNSWIDCNTGSFDCPPLERDPDEVYDIVTAQPFIDNAQVMHHMLLFGCKGVKTPPLIQSPQPCGMANSACYEIVSCWTVGSAGTCLNENVGYRFGKGLYTRVVLQAHWNNPELRSDYVDGSGMIVHYTRRLRENSATTLVLGQRQLAIPPRQPTVEVVGNCPSSCSRVLFRSTVYVTEALNHMHYLGKSQKIEVLRQNRLVSTITNEETYSYDNPVRVKHNPPLEIQPGDEVKVTCVYNSQTKNQTVYFGDATNDKMCYGFLTVYPQEALPYLKTCIAFGEESICDRFNINGGGRGEEDGDNTTRPDTSGPGTETPSGSGDDVIEGCRWQEITDTGSAEFQSILSRLAASCNAFGSCRAEC